MTARANRETTTAAAITYTPNRAEMIASINRGVKKNLLGFQTGEALLVGDAAGLAYPKSGEGIRPAVESALLAARAVAGGRLDEAARAGYERTVVERFGPRRAPGHVDVDGNHAVDAVADGVRELEESAAVGAAPHRDGVLRLGHLVVEELRAERHLEGERARDDVETDD